MNSSKISNHIILSSCQLYDIYNIHDVMKYNNSYVYYWTNNMITNIPQNMNIQLPDVVVPSIGLKKILYYNINKIIVLAGDKLINIDTIKKKSISYKIQVDILEIYIKNRILYILSPNNTLSIYKFINDRLKLQTCIKIKCTRLRRGPGDNDICTLYKNKYIIYKSQLYNKFKIYRINDNINIKKYFTIKLHNKIYISKIFTYNVKNNILITLCNFKIIIYNLNDNINNKYITIDDILDKKINNIITVDNYLLVFICGVIYFYYFYKYKFIRMKNMYIQDDNIYNATVKGIKIYDEKIYFIIDSDVVYIYKIEN